MGAHGVLDTAGLPTGSYVERSDSGFLLIAPSTDADLGDTSYPSLTPADQPDLDATYGGGGHALLFGVAGESTARMAIDSDGSMHYGPGAGQQFDTAFKRQASTAIEWAPPALMRPVCEKQCGCNFPNCTGREAHDGIHNFCSLCGPQFNAPISIQCYRHDL